MVLIKLLKHLRISPLYLIKKSNEDIEEKLLLRSIEKIEKVDLSYNKIRGLRLDSHSRGHDLRDEPFKDLVFMRKSDETGSGSWYLLELPADSLISYPHLDYNDKGVIAYVKFIA